MGLRERGTSDRCQERKGRRQLELGLCGSRVIESKLFRVFDLARAPSCLQNRGENSVLDSYCCIFLQHLWMAVCSTDDCSFQLLWMPTSCSR